MPKGRDVPPRPDPKPGPMIIALDPAMLEGEPWKRQTWVAHNWQMLAALAWRGHLAVGRGMVRVSVDPDVQACDYIPLSHADDYGVRANGRKFMQAYDPHRGMVVGFHERTPTRGNPGGNMLIFEFEAGGSLATPPDAYGSENQN